MPSGAEWLSAIMNDETRTNDVFEALTLDSRPGTSASLADVPLQVDDSAIFANGCPCCVRVF